jgi:histidinol-phosphate/aromatic aminotransferase/cobyric acid decarboxylase-like protein
MELVGALVRAFAGPGDEVLGSAFGYAFLATAAQQANARHMVAPEREFTVSVDAIATAVTSRTRLVFLCNPGNPTGTRLDNAEILRLRQTLRPDILLVVDQAYGEFDDQDHGAVFALANRGDTVILRTFSKAYALAGARVGWGVFPPAIAQEVRKLMNPNNVSGVAQSMAAAAMRDQAYMSQIVRRTARIRAQFAASLASGGYAIPRSHANFVLIPFRDADTAHCAGQRLRGAGLMMRGMGPYDLGHCLRATIAAEDVMRRAAHILVDLAQEASDAGD